ncbi:uncharacterized protein [Narcine bancroftii]|uniref:uncharacterized protein n=1 Tax=Narcine bancroftii TaxID=1343680 RepID=UPI0038310305
MHFKELSHLLSTFMCQNCKTMELGAVVRFVLLLFPLSCLNTSATPDLNRKIKNCYQLAVELNHSAPVALQSYLSVQGPPFNNALIKNHVCHRNVSCLPKRHLNKMEENEMLKKIFIGVQQFTWHLNNTIIQQKNLNPSSKLQFELENIRTYLMSLDANLLSILRNKGHHVSRQFECSSGHRNLSDKPFLQKQQGCVILTNFKHYIAQVLKYFHHLLRNFSHLSSTSHKTSE